MRVLVIGDPHFKKDNAVDTEEFTQAILSLTREKKPDFIVCLGDVLDRHESIHVYPLVRAVDFLRELGKIAPLYLLIGNHDRPNNSDFLSSVHPFTALEDNEVDGVVVVDHVVKDRGFLFVPYVPPGRFREAIDTLPDALVDTRTIFAHQEFKGAQMGAVRSINGDEWPTDASLVISGHIHDYERTQGNIVYVGTPIQHKFGDRDDKTVSLFSFDGDGGFKEERIDLGLTKKEIVHLRCDQILTWIPPEKRRIKLVLHGNSIEIKGVMKLDRIQELAERGIKIVYKTEDSRTGVGPEISIEPHITYLQRLAQVSSADPIQKSLFEEIFG